MFKVGDKAVYPAHGVGVIKGVEKKEISGNKLTFYILQIIETDITIMVPTNNVDRVGLRGLIKKRDIPKVLKILKDKRSKIDNQTWNRRYREYMDKIKTGSAFEVARVLRDLCRLRKDKELSFGERKMMDTARSLLIKELSYSSGKKEDSIAKEIDKIFKC